MSLGGIVLPHDPSPAFTVFIGVRLDEDTRKWLTSELTRLVARINSEQCVVY